MLMMNTAQGHWSSAVTMCWLIQTRAIAPTIPPAKMAASSRRSIRGTAEPRRVDGSHGALVWRSWPLIVDDQHGHRAGVDQILGDAGEQQSPGASVVVMSAHDQIKAVLVDVVEQSARGGVAIDDLVGDVDAGPSGAIGDLADGGLQVAVRVVGRLGPVGRGFGVGGGGGNRDGDKLGVVAAGDVDGDIE